MNKSRFEVLALMCELIDLRCKYIHTLQEYMQDISLSEVVSEVMEDMKCWSDEYDQVLSNMSLVDSIEVYVFLDDILFKKVGSSK